MTEKVPAVFPLQGRHCIHLFCKVNRSPWQLFSEDERRRAKLLLTAIAEEIRETAHTELLVFTVVSAKADLGFMLLTRDLHAANTFETKLILALGTGVLTPVFSFLSMTEASDETNLPAAPLATMPRPDTKDMEDELKKIVVEKEAAKRVKDFEKLYPLRDLERRAKEKLDPILKDWRKQCTLPVFCFYTMSARCPEGSQWEALDEEAREKLRSGWADLLYKSKVRQLLTGSVGLDGWENGVTLLAHNTSDIKAFLDDIRDSEFSRQTLDFGEFYIGVQVPVDELFCRLQL